MSIISLSSISKSFIDKEVLKDISLSVEPGEKIGLIGQNGSGKTTLLNVITGKLEPDEGNVYINSKTKIEYLTQINDYSCENTIIDEAFKSFEDLVEKEKLLRRLEMSISTCNHESDEYISLMDEYGNLTEEFENSGGYTYRSNVRGVLNGLGFFEKDFDTPISALSGGEKARLNLGLLLLKQPDVLLLDEPTNHLDMNAIDWLEKYLRDYKGTLIIISHDRYFLDKLVQRIILIEGGKAYSYRGNYSEFYSKRRSELEQRKALFLKQQKDLNRQKEIIQRFMNYGSARYIKQAQSRQKLLEKISLVDDVKESTKSQISFSVKRHSGRDVLRAENICKSFNERTVLNDISFNIFRGDKIGLIGGNGVGKTTVFKIITGAVAPDSGEVFIGSNVDFGYFTQEMENLSPEKTVIDEIWDDYSKLNHYQIRSYLAKFNFVGDDIFTCVGDMSGGEKGRLELLKLMMASNNTLLLDEPTNHLDIDSKESLEEALNSFDGTMIVISHDRYFLNSVCNKILELSPDGITEYLGNYDYYHNKKFSPAPDDYYEDEPSKTRLAKDRKADKLAKAALREKKKAVEKLELRISELEKEIENQDIRIQNAISEGRFNELGELNKKRMEMVNELDKLTEEWVHASENI